MSDTEHARRKSCNFEKKLSLGTIVWTASRNIIEIQKIQRTLEEIDAEEEEAVKELACKLDYKKSSWRRSREQYIQQIPGFWSKIFLCDKGPIAKHLTEAQKHCMMSLQRAEYYMEASCVIFFRFWFGPNPFFESSVITKQVMTDGEALKRTSVPTPNWSPGAMKELLETSEESYEKNFFIWLFSNMACNVFMKVVQVIENPMMLFKHIQKHEKSSKLNVEDHIDQAEEQDQKDTEETQERNNADDGNHMEKEGEASPDAETQEDMDDIEADSVREDETEEGSQTDDQAVSSCVDMVEPSDNACQDIPRFKVLIKMPLCPENEKCIQGLIVNNDFVLSEADGSPLNQEDTLRTLDMITTDIPLSDPKSTEQPENNATVEIQEPINQTECDCVDTHTGSNGQETTSDTKDLQSDAGNMQIDEAVQSDAATEPHEEAMLQDDMNNIEKDTDNIQKDEALIQNRAAVRPDNTAATQNAAAVTQNNTEVTQINAADIQNKAAGTQTDTVVSTVKPSRHQSAVAMQNYALAQRAAHNQLYQCIKTMESAANFLQNSTDAENPIEQKKQIYNILKAAVAMLEEPQDGTHQRDRAPAPIHEAGMPSEMSHVTLCNSNGELLGGPAREYFPYLHMDHYEECEEGVVYRRKVFMIKKIEYHEEDDIPVAVGYVEDGEFIPVHKFEHIEPDTANHVPEASPADSQSDDVDVFENYCEGDRELTDGKKLAKIFRELFSHEDHPWNTYHMYYQYYFISATLDEESAEDLKKLAQSKTEFKCPMHVEGLEPVAKPHFHRTVQFVEVDTEDETHEVIATFPITWYLDTYIEDKLPSGETEERSELYFYIGLPVACGGQRVDINKELILSTDMNCLGDFMKLGDWSRMPEEHELFMNMMKECHIKHLEETATQTPRVETTQEIIDERSKDSEADLTETTACPKVHVTEAGELVKYTETMDIPDMKGLHISESEPVVQVKTVVAEASSDTNI